LFFDFIEIGTSDFDTLIQGAGANVAGLSIDPVSAYLDMLPTPARCRKLNVGVSDHDGETTVFFVEPSTIAQHRLPDWIRGCSSLGVPHPTVLRCLENRNLDPGLIIERRVPVRRLASIIAEHGVDGIYLLKVDTEGHDETILTDHFRHCHPCLYPHELLFETNTLSDSARIHRLIARLLLTGYEIVSSSTRGEDSNTHLRLNILRVRRRTRFAAPIPGYFLRGYPEGYDPFNPRHSDTLEAAMEHCRRIGAGGVTFQYGRYEVRQGEHLLPHNVEGEVSSWVLIGD